jgi:hypothetical protein
MTTIFPKPFPESAGKFLVSQERLSHCAERRAKIAFAALTFRALNKKKSFDKAEAG